MTVTSAAIAIAVFSIVVAPDIRVAGPPVAIEAALSYQVIPRVLSARLKGNRLIVEGESFQERAVVLVDGRRLKTRNDLESPATRLIANKAGRQIARGKVVRVQVENPGAAVSEHLNVFTGRTITLDDNATTIRLALGEEVLLLLKRDSWDWTVTHSDPGILILVVNQPPIPGSQGLFQAAERGQTTLNGIGELPCHKARPPCRAPNLSFEVKVVVE